jgi:hypothetical protein
MRVLLIGLLLGLLAGLVLLLGPIATPAHAQNYPWCAYYGEPYDDSNCGFVSFEQCMEDVRGIGGFCQLNNTYVPPAGSGHRRKQPAH